MKIIKRNGSEATFDSEKIVVAITKANNSEEGTRLSPEQIHDIADYVEYKCNKIGRAVSVEEVQDMVENQIMATGAFDLAKHYVQYRYQRSLIRKSNTTDTRILSLIECNNEEAKQENSNKNPTVNSVQRDYMAGEVSRDLTQRLLLPSDIVEADQKGLIHFHDSDYFAQHMHNCDLVNLEDMLQNGTVISETKIEKPHSFSTACNIATQIIARPGQTYAGFYQSALAFSGQGICKVAALTLEGIRGFLLVILFGFPYVQDGVQAFYEIVIKMVCTSGVFPEQICELNGIAQRVDLIFAFPEPIAHFRLIVIPAVAVFFLIEGICIGIMVYKEKLSSGQTSQQVGNLLILCCSYQIGAHLCNGIPQPRRILLRRILFQQLFYAAFSEFLDAAK